MFIEWPECTGFHDSERVFNIAKFYQEVYVRVPTHN